MAKPLSTPPTFGFPGPSHHRTQSSSVSSQRPRPRCSRRRRSPSRTAALAPSSALLSLLATISSSSSANASPTPPSFLCPSLEILGTRDLPYFRRASVSQQPPQSSGIPKPRHPRYVPDKYAKDTDGVWRRVSSYTLYGSTVPTGCNSPDCRQPTKVVPSIDDQISVPSNSSSTTTTSPYDIQLPPGWKPTEKPPDNRTSIIVAMSLSLALLICFFIIGCLFWRKTRKRDKGLDIEAKANRSRRRRDMSSRERRNVDAEKEAKMVQKVWAKATARWKENVRYAARRRRGKRTSMRLSQAQLSSLSLNDSPLRTVNAESKPASRSPSPSPSIPEQIAQESQPCVPEPEPNAAETALSSTTGQPPAYHQRLLIPHIVISSHDSSSIDSNHGLSTTYSLSRQPSHASLNSSTPNSPHLSQYLDLNTPAAHVATDDKSVLARLADLASAPPDGDSPDFIEGSYAHVSVPAWQDEDMEDFSGLTEDSCPPIADAAHSAAFPPPPSKERLAAAERLEYSFNFDELEDMEPEPGPSAPPFEETSAAPPDESILLPSAPPLPDSPDFSAIMSRQPTTPIWEPSDIYPFSQDGEERPNQDQHRTASSNVGPSTDHSPSVNSADLISNVTTGPGPTSPLVNPLSLPDNSSPLPRYRP
ncbi:hypothetical protein CPB83DRAFT_891227 [Crepidotus variabilis]|uniref:Uncharacterized protein n=1 Tax=Crepidotus variabilis TaxID=179855 RepID=A0A9P6EMY4_9AGAR|nr:hypothetical protein CPB83DRAFT_891227 [Crepidotus variabilis]